MKYKSNRQNVCPVCNHEGLEYDGTGDSYDGVSCTYDWTCPNCGTEGREVEVRVFDGHIVYNKETDDLEVVPNPEVEPVKT